MEVNIGVPQGAVLSPILFALYINDIGNCLDPTCGVTLYADDSSLITSGRDDESLLMNCNSGLTTLTNWYDLNLLYLNSSKTHYIRFHTRQKECNYLNIAVKNTPLSVRESASFLGVELDCHLNWNAHCSNIIADLSSSCFLFRSLRRLLNADQLTMLYHARVGSRLRYAIVLWGNACYAKDVFLCQKRVIRSILGLRPSDTCRQAFRALGILTLASLYVLELSVYVYKHKHTFTLTQDVSGVCTRGGLNLRVRAARLDIARDLPDYIGLKIFNRLPNAIKTLPSLVLFKKHLKSFLLDHSFYSLSEFYDRLAGG